jgi:Tub family
VQSNFIGTEFIAYDRGERSLKKAQQMAVLTGVSAPSGSENAQTTGNGSGSERGSVGSDTDAAVSGRAELAVVQYHMNVMGTKGPRKMTIGIPYVDFDTNDAVLWMGVRAQDGMLARCACRPCPPGCRRYFALAHRCASAIPC